MPEGADTVFMQEDVRLDEAGRVIVAGRASKRGANVRPAGEDIALGRVIVPAKSLAAPAGRGALRRRWASRRSACAGA